MDCYVVPFKGMLEIVLYFSFLIKVMLNCALNDGSSKQGNTLLAYAGSRNVTTASFLQRKIKANTKGFFDNLLTH